LKKKELGLLMRTNIIAIYLNIAPEADFPLPIVTNEHLICSVQRDIHKTPRPRKFGKHSRCYLTACLDEPRTALVLPELSAIQDQRTRRSKSEISRAGQKWDHSGQQSIRDIGPYLPAIQALLQC